MKALVTGSDGLVGTALKKVLGPNHVYHTKKDMDLKNYSTTNAYIAYCVNNLEIDTIIHCAAKVGGVHANSSKNDQFFTTNSIIDHNVIMSAFIHKIKNLINISSTCVFSDTGVSYPLTADQINVGIPHFSNRGYAYAKRISGENVSIMRIMSGYNWITVIATNVYGPNDNFSPEYSHLIPSLIYRAHHHKDGKFVVWGDGTSLRQFIHSLDLAKNIVWAIDNWKQPVPFMAVNPREYSVKEIAETVIKNFNIKKENITYDINQISGLFRRPASTDVIDSYQFIPLETGIKDTIRWFQENYNEARK